MELLPSQREDTDIYRKNVHTDIYGKKNEEAARKSGVN